MTTDSITDITGINFSIYNELFVEKTITGRLSETQCSCLEEYTAYLQNNRSETNKLKKALNNNFSEFFRNTLTFAFVEHTLLPALAERKTKKGLHEIRIWSAACAAGQEAYSIAMLCDAFSKNHHSGIRFRIFATDISETNIQNAQHGVYPESALKQVIYDWVKTYFTQKNDRFIVHSKLKESIDFSTFDLLDKACDCPPASIYGNFDIVFCANLLFYYTPDAYKRILDKVDNCLADKGYLIVGDAEKEIAGNKKNYHRFAHLPILQKSV